MFGFTKEKKVMVSLTRTEYRLAWDALMTLRKNSSPKGVIPTPSTIFC